MERFLPRQVAVLDGPAGTVFVHAKTPDQFLLADLTRLGPIDPRHAAWLTTRLVDIAARHARGRLVSSLEGGYSLDALRESTAAHVAALAG
jgi:hypothetical protein